MKNIFILFTILFLLSCENDLNIVQKTKSNFNIEIQSTNNRAIIVEEYVVTKLEIEISGETQKSITWYPTDDSQISLSLPVGDYHILVKHYFNRDDEENYYEESSSFSIKPNVISLVKIVPGAIGFVEVSDTDNDTDDKNLDYLKKAIIGKWTGTVATPWIDDYIVEVEFKEDGTYSANSFDSNNSAFYYGTDEDSPLKTYRLYDQYANGEGVASIVVLFHAGTTNRSELDYINFSDNGNKLTFEYWHRSEYGPVTFDLTRIK